MKEEEIIQLLQSGKIEKAFTKLYKLFPKVNSVLKKYGATKDESNDIFQDALVVLYQKLQQEDFRITSSMEAYIMNTSKFMFLKTKRGVGTNVEIIDLVHEESDLERFLLEDKKVEQAQNALNQIGERCRQILQNFYIDKMSMIEIAKRFSFSSENAAKVQKYKCLESARKTYDTLLKTTINH